MLNANSAPRELILRILALMTPLAFLVSLHHQAPIEERNSNVPSLFPALALYSVLYKHT